MVTSEPAGICGTSMPLRSSPGAGPTMTAVKRNTALMTTTSATKTLLYHAIGARAEEDGRSDRDHDHPGSGCPAERQLKPQRGAEQVSRLVGGVANSNGERHQPECRVAQEWSTKALTDCVAQSRAADDPQASGHFLQNGSSDDREDDGPEQREAVACPGA